METTKNEIRTRGRVSIVRAEGGENENGGARGERGEARSRLIRGTAIILGEMTEIYSDDELTVRERILPGAVTDELLRGSDILLTLYHDASRILGRSKQGKGTLTWTIGAKGVDFECELPETPDGDTALAAVERGDVDGCSFWANARRDSIKETTWEENGRWIVEREISGFEEIRDFTLTPRPAYEQTWVEAVKRSAEEMRQSRGGDGSATAEEVQIKRESAISELESIASRLIGN